MHIDSTAHVRLNELALESLACGVFAVDRDYKVVLWNRFMADRSGISAAQALGRSLFELFPELPVAWLKKKFETVFVLKISAFTSWEHRPYLFRFRHDRPITGDLDWMQQDCAFAPLIEGVEVTAVCVTIIDVTDLALAQRAREDAVEALRETSVRDGLTGLYNRRHVENRLADEFGRWLRSGRALSVLILDLDHFKHINDTYGHPAGDAVLKSVAARVLTCLRESDVLARYGGEEFIVLLSATTLAEAATVGERIRRSIASGKVSYAGQLITVTASIGAAQVRVGATNHEALVREADEALYDAKSSGRNRLVAGACAPT